MAVSKQHREKSWKAGKCQRCGAKVAKQYRAERHGGGGKWGKGKVRFKIEEVQSASPSHYCRDCAEAQADPRPLGREGQRRGETERQRAKAKAAK